MGSGASRTSSNHFKPHHPNHHRHHNEDNHSLLIMDNDSKIELVIEGVSSTPQSAGNGTIRSSIATPQRHQQQQQQRHSQGRLNSVSRSVSSSRRGSIKPNGTVEISKSMDADFLDGSVSARRQSEYRSLSASNITRASLVTMLGRSFSTRHAGDHDEDDSFIGSMLRDNSTQSLSASSLLKGDDLLSFHGDILLDGKPLLVSLMINNMDELVIFTSDLKSKFYVYETSYQRFLQRFYSNDDSAASLSAQSRHRRMLDMLTSAFSSQSYSIASDLEASSSLRMTLTLRYPPEDIDKTVIFRLFEHVPDLTDLSSQMVNSSFCKLVTSFYAYYQGFSKHVRATFHRTNIVPSFAVNTDYGTVGPLEESGNSEPSEDGVVRIEKDDEDKQNPTKTHNTSTPPTSSIEPLTPTTQNTTSDRVNLMSVIHPQDSMLMSNPQDPMTTSLSLQQPEEPPTLQVQEVIKFLQQILQNESITCIDKPKLFLVIQTIAKTLDVSEEEPKPAQVSHDTEVNAFISTFVKPRTREKAGWKTIANLIRVGNIFKRQPIEGALSLLESNPDVQECMNNIERYDFDIFVLNDASKGNPLYVVVHYFLRKYNLIEHFNIDKEILHTFLRHVELNYGTNPFHNHIHAADVLHTFMFILETTGIIPLLSLEELLAVILAAAVHDFQHPGTTNQFQIQSCSDLAITYNDKSVLESHHVASFYDLLKNEKYNILKGLTPKQRRYVREIVIGLVSATDLSFQQGFMNQMQAMMDVGKQTSDLEQEKIFFLKMCLKVADTSNTSKPLFLHLPWINRLQQEFFLQGDKEKERQMDGSPFMDREKSNVAKCQYSFIEYVTLPLVTLFVQKFKECHIILEYSILVKEFWASHIGVTTLAEVEQLIRKEFEKNGREPSYSHLNIYPINPIAPMHN
ncbi:hypothetical protein C9374_007466 [Naegleria lovaniensis]|uniref:Phosphodiesterase n=1 Tax=Naegleria lovaniensis TaxID=51637 RepID=A0AA88GH35_NAELO|nr:uncharacterized protein C9374_007466 [Naegleria lovaniensis]KAG2379327.1 hypothetical protein C9374_007466 [Naegleria lovaniensis]